MDTRVLILGSPNAFEKYFVKHLLDQGIHVAIVTDSLKQWETENFSSSISRALPVGGPEDLEDPPHYIFNFQNDSDEVQNFFPDGWSSKIINITRDEFTGDESSISSNKTITLGDIYGPGIPISNNLFGRIMQSVSAGGSPEKLDTPSTIYPVYFVDALEQLLCAALSFGTEDVFVGDETLANDFIIKLKRLKSQIDNPSPNYLESAGDISYIETLKYFMDLMEESEQEEISSPPKKPKRPSINLKLPKHKTTPIMFALLSFFLLPSFLLALGYLLFATVKPLVSSNHLRAALNANKASYTLTNSSAAFAQKLSIGPASTFYDSNTRIAQKLNNLSQTTSTYISALDSLNQITQLLQSEKTEEIPDLAQSLSRDLQVLYTQSAFLEGENKTGILMLSNPIPSTFEKASTLAQKLPIFLGFDTPKTYLLLLQNNLSAKPTGGAIEAFGIITIEKGIITQSSFYNSSDPAANIKGFVRPPSPLSEYQGESRWLIKDSNWDPNFATSARRAEWFVAKALNTPTDGVIALNLNFIKSSIGLNGPLVINDINGEVTASNLDQLLSKSNSSELLLNLFKETLSSYKNNQRPWEAIQAIVSLVDSKEVQAFANNPDTSNVLGAISMTGELEPSECTNNCQSIITGIIESNMSDTHISNQIGRKAKFNSMFNHGEVNNSLILDLTNNSKETYKTYIRILANPDSQFSQVKITSPGNTNYVQADYKILNKRAEAGVYIEVPAKKITKLKFEWVNNRVVDTNEPGSVKVYWYSQPGINEYPIAINLGLPTGIYTSNLPVSLTSQGDVTYNTRLSKDLRLNIYWNNEDTQP